MNFKTITFQEPEQGIGILTLNRPDQLNAINKDMLDDLHELFSYLHEHTETRVLIMTGAGRGFCAGADLNDPWIKTENTNSAAHLVNVQKKYADRILEMRRLPQPIIASVNGPAAGGGMCLALASDISIVSEKAYFVPSFANIGLSGGELGTSYFLPRAVGRSRASEILLTGRTVGAEEAERIGMISRKVSEADLMATTMETARRMIAKGPLGLRLTKEAINQNIDAQSLDTAIEVENKNQSICCGTPDFHNSVMSFRKRKSE